MDKNLNLSKSRHTSKCPPTRGNWYRHVSAEVYVEPEIPVHTASGWAGHIPTVRAVQKIRICRRTQS